MHAFQVSLRNGKWLRIRPVEPGDEAVLAVLMGPRQRAIRIAAGMRQHVPARLPREPASGRANHTAWVAVAINEPGQPIVGAARFVRLPADEATADATVAVTSRFRGQGLGRLLLETLMLVALETGVARLVARVQPENAAGGRLFRSLGARATRAADGSLDYDLPVGWGERTLASSSGFRAPRPEHLRPPARSGESASRDPGT